MLQRIDPMAEAGDETVVSEMPEVAYRGGISCRALLPVQN